MENGTASKMTVGQFREFAGAVLRSLPDDLDPTTAQGWIENQESLRRILRDILVPNEKTATPLAKSAFAIPADNEEFTLEVDNDADPMDLVISAGYDKKGWKYLGPALLGKKVYKARLVHLGPIENLEKAKQATDKLGYRLLEGQAREAFKAKYPKPDDTEMIIFGGSEWQNPGGISGATYLQKGIGAWCSYFSFYSYVSGFHAYCRWAVVDKSA